MDQTAPTRTIGLSLSGGGARAMAFQLGCLEALNEAGILNQVTAISATSGGSVLAALYCTRNESFAEFDARATRILKRGIFRDIVGSALSPATINAFVALTVSGAAAIAWGTAATVIGFLPLGWRKKAALKRRLRSPVPRWATRTDAFERALRSPGILGDALVSQPVENRPELLVNAADLCTQTAFRFTPAGIGSWRHGHAECQALRWSEAVAASAAFPLLLPSIEREFTFEQGGEHTKRSVLLTDGGVYDNLGLEVFNPLRPAKYTFGARRVDFIIACVAEPGLPDGQATPRCEIACNVVPLRGIFRVED